jgi:hypothetical protein
MSDLTERLRSLHTEQTKLVEELDKALAIKHLWAAAFDHGNAKSQWIPNAVKRSQFDQLLNPDVHFGESLLVTNGMGDAKKFPYDAVPNILGGGRKD